MDKLNGKKFAVLATDGFEASELFEPVQAIKDAGGELDIISLKEGKIKSWESGDWGKTIEVDKVVSAVSVDDYAGLLLPGGVINPDNLRRNKDAVSFVSGFFKQGKQLPVAAICHGPWMLVEAGVVKGRELTSYDSIKTDIINAGGHWVDRSVVVDKGLVTSRNPDDLSDFKEKMIEEFCEGTHQRKAG